MENQKYEYLIPDGLSKEWREYILSQFTYREELARIQGSDYFEYEENRLRLFNRLIGSIPTEPGLEKFSDVLDEVVAEYNKKEYGEKNLPKPPLPRPTVPRFVTTDN